MYLLQGKQKRANPVASTLFFIHRSITIGISNSGLRTVWSAFADRGASKWQK